LATDGVADDRDLDVIDPGRRERPQACDRAVAQHRSRRAVKEGGVLTSERWLRSVADEIDAGESRMKRPQLHAPLNHLRRETRREELLARHIAALSQGPLGHHRLEFSRLAPYRG
jgi:hypothetical protein